ncbi:MAG: type II secretion system F family protein [Nitrospirae bacterium]|nr:type II secretion system F family protein [Nitrospirota bacterium]MBI3604411.1 type II secretion system F family protein [Nitrospirota bacterium]
MPTFTCRMAAADGTIIEEKLDGPSEASLKESLEKKGFLVFSVKKASFFSLFRLTAGLRAKKKLTSQEFLVYNYEFVALIRAGLPILKAFDLLEGRALHPGFKEALNGVRKEIEGGSSISDALSHYHDFFPEIYISSVRAGEKSGNLVEILNRYILFYKKILAVRKKIMTALTYPVFLFVVGAAVILFLLTYVLPTFSDIYSDAKEQLPWLTMALISFVTFLKGHFIFILLGTGIIFFLLQMFFSSEKGKDRKDSLLLKVPVLGEIIKNQQMIAIGRTLATILSGGITLVNGLEMVAESLPNRVYSKRVHFSIQKVQEGTSLAAAFDTADLMPKIAIEMIEVGETTGSLEEMLNQVAEFQEEMLDQKLTRITTWVEPVLLLFMGVLVAIILVAMYLPIFNLAGTLK